MSLSETLKRTKAELLARGWHQGTYVHHATGAVCLEGALNCALFGTPLPDYVDAPQVFADALIALRMNMDTCVAIWNDAPDRTPEEVLDVVDAAITQAEAHEAAPDRVAVCA